MKNHRQQAGLCPTERAAVYDALPALARNRPLPTLNARCRLVFTFIQRDFLRADAKYRRRIQQRREAGSRHSGNRYTRKMERNGTKWNERGTKWNIM